jgi:hypothetical protein
MILSSIFAFAGFICLAHAFVVPQHIEDGVHGVDMDKRGANFLEDSSVLVRTATNIITNALAIRDGSSYTPPPDRIHCGCGFSLDLTNYDLAVKDMQTTLRNNIAADFFPANTTSIKRKRHCLCMQGRRPGCCTRRKRHWVFYLEVKDSEGVWHVYRRDVLHIPPNRCQ